MTNKEYVDGVLRTESPVTPEMLERFKNTNTLRYLFDMFEDVLSVGGDLDRLKKHLFYGKDLIESEIGRATGVPHEVCLRLQNPETIRILHAVVGIATEATEMIQELYERHIIEGRPLDKVNLIEEGGDMFWYLGVLSDALQSTFDEVQMRNNRKLRARYPQKFTEGDALNRNLEVERDILEKS